MAECHACGANIRPGTKVCPACKAPIRNNGTYERGPRYGMCEYNDHGMYCGRTGSIALHTGAGGPWYCSEHALGLRGMRAKKPVAAPQPIRSFVETDEEARAEREAIQGEAPR